MIDHLQDAIDKIAQKNLERKRLAMQRAVNLTARVNMRITENERTMLDSVAREMGETLSQFVRNAALDVARAMIEAEGKEPPA